MTGHFKRNCPKKSKSKQEIGLGVPNATTPFGDTALLEAIEAEVQVADSAATQHMTKCRDGFVEHPAVDVVMSE